MDAQVINDTIAHNYYNKVIGNKNLLHIIFFKVYLFSLLNIYI